MPHLHTLKKKKTVLTILLLGSLLGFVLQIIRNVTGGVLPAVLFTVLSLLALVFAVLTAGQFRPRPGFLQNHLPTPALLVQLPAAALMLLASVIHLFLKSEPAPVLIGLTGIIGAVCMAGCTCFAVIRQRPSVLLYVTLVVCLLCRLIPEFRAWSISPDLGSYAPQFLGLLTAMLTCFHLGGFALDAGSRYISMIFCMVGIFFNLVSLAAGGIYQILSALSFVLFLSAELWELMTLPRRRRGTPAKG